MSHPSRKQYLGVFLGLAVLTIVEVGIVYLTGISRGLMIAALTALAVTKAALVGLFFMHLKSETSYLKATVLVPMSMPALFAIVLVAEAMWRSAP
jgi:cytochrome c oxidase subunit 4